MYIHYITICDKCGEGKEIYVNNPSRTARMLYEQDSAISKFLEKHYGCELRLIHRDDQIDQLWEQGYVVDYDTNEYIRI